METGDSGGLDRPTVHVVVTCTNRKTRPVPPELCLRNVRDGDVAGTARSWTSRLEDGGESLVPAHDLYAGEHWTVARRLAARHETAADVCLWVCSAGYGLIPADATVRPYSATFAPGQEDSTPGDDGGRAWWQALADWWGPSPRAPRSVRELVTSDPGALFILALSSPYVRACQDDIRAAAESKVDTDRMMVVSVGTNGGALADLMVPADSRLQAHLGGTRLALNARIAAYLVEQRISGREQGVQELRELLAAQPPIPRYDRKKLTDEEVLAFINKADQRSRTVSANRLLRELRDGGHACEQKRFTQLFRTFMEARR